MIIRFMDAVNMASARALFGDHHVFKVRIALRRSPACGFVIAVQGDRHEVAGVGFHEHSRLGGIDLAGNRVRNGVGHVALDRPLVIGHATDADFIAARIRVTFVIAKELLQVGRHAVGDVEKHVVIRLAIGAASIEFVGLRDRLHGHVSRQRDRTEITSVRLLPELALIRISRGGCGNGRCGRTGYGRKGRSGGRV